MFLLGTNLFLTKHLHSMAGILQFHKNLVGEIPFLVLTPAGVNLFLTTTFQAEHHTSCRCIIKNQLL